MSRGLVTFIGDNPRARRSKAYRVFPVHPPARTVAHQAKIRSSAWDTSHGDGVLVYRLSYNGDIVAFKMGRRQGARRAHI
jgi:hypothetical protein